MTRKNNNSPLACLDKGERNYSPLEGGWGVLARQNSRKEVLIIPP